MLPGPVLIADEDNDRIIVVDPQGRIIWTFPEPGDLRAGETFKTPDDAFYTADGKQIIVTHEENFAVSLVDIASRRIVWRYGTPGVHGHGPNQLWNPDDAMVLPDGPRASTARTAGRRAAASTTRRASSAAPTAPSRCATATTSSPRSRGRDLKTGTVIRSFKVPGVRYPSDSNEIEPGRFITADYSKPGQLVMFDGAGKVLWRYKPTGKDALDHPSLAIALPNGMVLANDDANHRVIIVDPKTNRIVWQYGATGKKGREPGRLNTPDGVDLAPPYSLLIQHEKTMGRP